MTDREILIQYLLMKVRQEDWHGVSDAANDLREMDAREKIAESKEQLRLWVGLTGDEIEDINKDQTLWGIIRTAEEILKEKNT